MGTTSAFPFGGVEERQRYGSYASFSPVVEAEGLDRTDLLLPGRQLDLIQVRAGWGVAGGGRASAMRLPAWRRASRGTAGRAHAWRPTCPAAAPQAVAKRSSTPIAVVLVHGAPLDVQWLQASPRVSSILSVWMPAQVSAALRRKQCSSLLGVMCAAPASRPARP